MGELFSFWVSPYETGESLVFTAGGGLDLHPPGQGLPQNRH